MEPARAASPSPVVSKPSTPVTSGKPVRTGLKLGSKSNAPASFMEQLAKEGEVTAAPPTLSAGGAQRAAPDVQVARDPYENINVAFQAYNSCSLGLKLRLWKDSTSPLIAKVFSPSSL